MSEESKRETWKNNLYGDYWYQTLDTRGRIGHKAAKPNRPFSLTVEERRLNEESVAMDDQNPFRNGTFSPVTLVDTVEEYEEIVSDPNVRSEGDIKDLLDLNAKELRAELAKIDSKAILSILMTEVSGEDSDYSAAKIRAVKDRHGEVVGEIKVKPALGPSEAPKENPHLV